MLPVTKYPMGPDLHISKMAAIHTTKMLIAITHYQSADFYNFGVKDMVFRYAEFISGVQK